MFPGISGKQRFSGARGPCDAADFQSEASIAQKGKENLLFCVFLFAKNHCVYYIRKSELTTVNKGSLCHSTVMTLL